MSDTGNDIGNDLLDTPEFAALAAARTVPPPSAAILAAALAAVRAAAAAEDVPVAAAAPAPRSRHHRRRWIAAAACVAAIAAGVSVLPTVGRGGQSPASANAASAFLNEVAAHTAGPDPGEVKVWRTSMKVLHPGIGTQDATLYQDSHRMVYRSRVIGYRSVPRGPGAESGWPVNNGQVSWSQLPGLPTGTDALRARLTNGSPPDIFTFRAISDLLATSPADTALRAALFRVLASLPGVHLDGPANDILGRPGIEISKSGQDFGDTVTIRLLIERRTGRLLQTEDVALRPIHLNGVVIKPGQVSDRTTYVSSGPVAAMPADPPRRQVAAH